MLLCSVYNRPFSVATWKTLERLVEMADYYCALPCLSRTLLAAIHRGPPQDICAQPAKCLSAATKLRNPELFKDSLIHMLRPWNPFDSGFANDAWYDTYKDLDPKLQRIVTEARNRMSNLVAKTQQEIMLLRMSSKTLQEQFQEVELDILRQSTRATDRNCISMPSYFRRLKNVKWRGVDGWRMSMILFPILLNSLQFDQAAVSGERLYVDSFLCSCIDDDDLPWDQTQEDW